MCFLNESCFYLFCLYYLNIRILWIWFEQSNDLIICCIFSVPHDRCMILFWFSYVVVLYIYIYHIFLLLDYRGAEMNSKQSILISPLNVIVLYHMIILYIFVKFVLYSFCFDVFHFISYIHIVDLQQIWQHEDCCCTLSGWDKQLNL